jgi:hypothetical protein
MVKILVDLAGALRQRTQHEWLLYMGVAVWIAINVQGFFEVNLGNSEVLHLFLVAMACAYCSTTETHGKPLEATPG